MRIFPLYIYRNANTVTPIGYQWLILNKLNGNFFLWSTFRVKK